MRFNIKKYKPYIKGLSLLGFILAYAIVKFTIMSVSASEIEIYHFGGMIEIDKVSLCGILTEMQIMIFVLLVVNHEKKGYIISMMMCSYSFATQVIPIILGREITSVTGIVMIVSGAIISMIIYRYGVNLNKQKEQLNEMAVYDSLTGLVNRRTIINELNRLVKSNACHIFSVVYIDIDNFKKINDSAGHGQGDILLMEITKKWKNIVYPKDILGRIGGDEFALIIKGRLMQEELISYIQEFEDIVAEEVEVNKRTYKFTASFGVATYPENAKEADQLLKFADVAMYEAKLSGKNSIKFFSEKMYEEMVNKIKLEEALARSVEQEELFLVYQPQYSCHGKELRGFEVLLRWKSKEFGEVSPSIFIPIAERTGLIISMGSWVIENACRDFKELMLSYHENKTLSINISALQLLEPNFMNMVKEVLDRTGFDPNYLEFEITESTFISSKEYIINILHELKELGIRIALDDFGTSYASLSYIQMLPLDILKIDKSFIDHIIDKDNERNLVGIIIALAQQLKYEVVAEGIEQIEQIYYLDEKGCNYIQGYLWGKPLIKEEVIQLLQKIEA